MKTKLSKNQILQLLNSLNLELAKSETTGEIYLVGGAVMCLAFNARDSTVDLDGLFKPTQKIRLAAQTIALQYNLDENWLNDAVKGFFSEQNDFLLFLDLPNLKVYLATAEYLLAMKAISFRIGSEFTDEEDIRFLIRYLNIKTKEQALKIISLYYPLDRLPQKTFYALEEILANYK